MFEGLRRIFSRKSAVDTAKLNPDLRHTVEEASEIESRLPLRDYVDEKRRRVMARQLFLELNAIFSSLDPRTACRDRLVRTMLEFARLQVLYIPPAPSPDPSGLRGTPGVTGELGDRLDELLRRNTDLRAELEGDEPAELDPQTARRVLRERYWTTRWFLEAFEAARRRLGDTGGASDWYPPFLHAACAYQEHLFRRDLELPAAFPGIRAAEIATAYSIYTDVVVSGAEDPDREWRDYVRGSGLELPTAQSRVA